MGGSGQRRLGYTFRGVPARPDVAIGIFAHNLRAILGVFGLLLVAQIAARATGGAGRAQRVTIMVGEADPRRRVASTNVLVVGAALGAYGPRMVLAMLPHGPIELAAYSLALGLYLAGPATSAARRSRGQGRRDQRGAARPRGRPRDVRDRMRPLRALAIVLLIAGGVGASALLIAKEARSLHGSPLFASPGDRPLSPVARHGHQRERIVAHARPWLADPHRAGRHVVGPRSDRRGVSGHAHAGGLLHASWLTVLLVVAAEIAAGALLVAVLVVALVVRRVRMRSRRKYALYELHLSMHDQAKPQDLEDMVEAIANIVRAFPTERARSGQPYVALELICGEGEQGMEWSINVRCQPSAARALDAAISAAYPDVRLGRRHADAPLPRIGIAPRAGVRDALSQGAQLRVPAARRRRGARLAPARADRPRPGRARSAVDRALSAHPHPVLLRGVRPPALQAPREQARAPGALGAARRRPAVDAQPDRDAQRGAHPEPQPVLARDW